MNLPLLKQGVQEVFFEYFIYFANKDTKHGIKWTTSLNVAILLAESFKHLVPFLLTHEESWEEKTVSTVITRQ